MKINISGHKYEKSKRPEVLAVYKLIELRWNAFWQYIDKVSRCKILNKRQLYNMAWCRLEWHTWTATETGKSDI